MAAQSVGRRTRLGLVLGGAIAGGLALLSWTQPWIDVVLTGGQQLSVPGQVAAPALSALALAALALSGALAIAGRVLRVVLGVIEAGIGILIGSAAISAMIAPVAASAAAITDATAIAGGDSIAALVASAGVTGWPVLAIVAGAIAGLAGIGVALTAHRWPGPTRKYEAAPAAGESSTVGAWDTLSNGGDPT